MRHLLPLLLSILAWLPAAATPLDDARAARDGARVAVAGITQERAVQVARHEAIAARIAALKAQGGAGLVPGTRDGRLDDLLKQAGAQADKVAALDRQLQAAQAELTARRQALAAGLGEALAEGQRELMAQPMGERAQAFEALRRLAEEQSGVNAALAQVVEAPAPLPKLSPVDQGAGPDELRELADEAQDTAERVRRQLEQVEARLEALRDRRRLMRAAVAFRRDEALFAESERNRVVVRASEPGAGRATAGDGLAPADQATGREPGPVAVGDVTDNAPPPGAPEPEAPAAGGAESGGDRNGGDMDGDGFAGAAETDTADPVADDGQTAGPALDFADPFSGGGPGASAGGVLAVDQVLDPALLAGDVDDLSPEALSRQIATIEARRADLEASAKALEARRQRLERRAATLEGQ